MTVFHRIGRRHLDQLVAFENLGPAQAAGNRMAVGQGLLDGADLRVVQRSLEVPAFDPVDLPAVALLSWRRPRRPATGRAVRGPGRPPA